jgi:large subunit ribosomal protein L17
MMHNRAGRKLRRTTPHRLALFTNQLTSLMHHERIETTLTEAKELRPLAERLITIGKRDGIESRRRVARWIADRDAVRKVFEKIAPRFVDRPGGYTRILRLGSRAGDGAETAILEFVDFRFEPKEKGPRKESMAEAARRAAKGRVETYRKEKPEGEGEGEERRAAPKARSGKEKLGKTAPKRGPSRTGPSKRGA